MKTALAVLAGAVLLMSACGGSDTLGDSCESDSECSGGQSCIKRWQTTVTINGTSACDVNYKICTLRCSSSSTSACSAAGGQCLGQDSCGGATNLCVH